MLKHQVSSSEVLELNLKPTESCCELQVVENAGDLDGVYQLKVR